MTTTLFVCNCCGRIAQAQTQPVLVPGRAPLIQVECKTVGCHNENWTYTYRDGEDNEQVLSLYTPVTMDADQVGRYTNAIDFAVSKG
jgi:hypothetical protein